MGMSVGGTGGMGREGYWRTVLQWEVKVIGVSMEDAINVLYTRNVSRVLGKYLYLIL